MKVSVLIPCYNEEKTIKKIIEKILNVEVELHEIIVVDDNSFDNSRKIVEELSSTHKKIKFFKNNINLGKGSAIRLGLEKVSGDVVIFQDADLEYNPSEYNKLLLPFIETDADVVYGSRFLGGNYSRLHFFWHYIANKLLTTLCNVFTNLNMTDMETGYKVFKMNILNNINLKENSFGIEPEITIKLSKKKAIFYEVPISYQGRSYDEGKKIRLKDAFIAVYCLFKYKFFD
tara:strand:- start:296 stop:988 length:693 start_codon:yes stop_codon:yes gene_type:complete